MICRLFKKRSVSIFHTKFNNPGIFEVFFLLLPVCLPRISIFGHGNYRMGEVTWPLTSEQKYLLKTISSICCCWEVGKNSSSSFKSLERLKSRRILCGFWRVDGLCRDCAIRSYNFSLSGKFFFFWRRVVDLNGRALSDSNGFGLLSNVFFGDFNFIFVTRYFRVDIRSRRHVHLGLSRKQSFLKCTEITFTGGKD